MNLFDKLLSSSKCVRSIWNVKHLKVKRQVVCLLSRRPVDNKSNFRRGKAAGVLTINKGALSHKLPGPGTLLLFNFMYWL